ncbi:helix-turn-helix transcriptional regulator [Phaeovibrio sulfidiphilus]|uniref:Helix-turn-helix transcriptional regulator n=1 Tax=Phaeovibrio sulfidiphilus TaxID=1220600 RepID=A0A8J6YHJ2_9PROT|nr:helix-turn-helix transcriptional regulator [Phaeovibrio sulfidiphilus]MBE1236396.1 helix-turn-helix transcriptional regulator [Phaeovibrio sulfidiphilus]
MKKEETNRTRAYTSNNPDPIDVEVGRRLRARRKVLALSQQQLADTVGITFQQVQKYERGLNRLSASRIWHFSCIMGVSIDYFFDDMEGVDINRAVPRAQRDAEKLSFISGVDDPASRADTLELCNAFWSAPPRARQGFVDFITICADEEEATKAARQTRNTFPADQGGAAKEASSETPGTGPEDEGDFWSAILPRRKD